jgi:hypothetical protein
VTAKELPQLITLRELSGRSGIAAQRIIDAVACGRITPDFIASSGSILFHPTRVAEIKATMSQPYGLARAIAANSRRNSHA